MAIYLVTGGCGFIGSHLCAALRTEGHGVRVLDNLSTGRESSMPRGTEFMHGDINDPAAIQAAMVGVAGCFHLAAVASVELGRRDWQGTHRTNLSGTIAVLAAAARSQPPTPVVYASSAAVYGDCGALPLAEDAPTRPLSAYGADKLGCEQHARVGGLVHGVPTFGLRFFNVFGPRQDPSSPYSGVISIFCERLSRGQTIQIHGDGDQSRDFIGVGDVVTAMLAAMRHVSIAAPVLNVCTGRATTVRELAEIAAKICGAPARFDHAPPRRGDIRHSVGDPRRAQACLSLPAPAAVGEGLTGVVDWLRRGAPYDP